MEGGTKEITHKLSINNARNLERHVFLHLGQGLFEPFAFWRSRSIASLKVAMSQKLPGDWETMYHWFIVDIRDLEDSQLR